MTGRFPRSERLPSGAAFQALFKNGKRIERASLVLLWRPGRSGRRVGFAVSRQVGGAVARNRVRRRLREAYRATRQGTPDGIDLIVVGKRAAAAVALETLETELASALAAIGRRPGGS